MYVRHWCINKKNYLSISNSNASKSYLLMQLSSKFTQKSYLSNAVSSNFFYVRVWFSMGKSEKRKKLHGFSYRYTNIENFEMFYPILFLKTDILAQLDII